VELKKANVAQVQSDGEDSSRWNDKGRQEQIVQDLQVLEGAWA
jgi:hypothetical protein